jgi:hypothetical protein
MNSGVCRPRALDEVVPNRCLFCCHWSGKGSAAALLFGLWEDLELSMAHAVLLVS